MFLDQRGKRLTRCPHSWAEEYSISIVLVHRGENAILLLRRFGGIRQYHNVVGLVEPFLNAQRQFSEEGVRDVRNDEANGVRALRAQGSRGTMVHVAEFLHGCQD